MITNICIYGLDLAVEYNYTQQHKRKFMAPDETGGEVDIAGVYINSVDISELLSEDVTRKIEQKIDEIESAR
jgi:reverse gyrase